MLWALGALKARPPRWYVLACPGEVWQTLVVLDDPPVHVMDDGTHTPTISTVFDLMLELRVLLL
jgi:hypothetical protein